jgi:DNA-binding NarL/FixJ family response regulator
MDGAPHPTRVLIIDPHIEDREYWAERLSNSSNDYVVLKAESGAEGLAICRSQRVDCIVTELSLPDMSGFQMLIDLVPRAYRPDMAVIMLARLKLDSMVSLARTNGAQAYLVKSQISGDDLDQAVRKAIATVGPSKNRQS